MIMEDRKKCDKEVMRSLDGGRKNSWPNENEESASRIGDAGCKVNT